MVRHGASNRQKKLIKIAIGEGHPTLQEMVSRALFVESKSFQSRNLPLISDEALISVSPDVCVWLCMLISIVAPENRLLQTAKSLAISRNRKVFVALMLVVGPSHRTEAQHDAIASFLPANVVAQLVKMEETECSENLTYLDDLGDVQSVERIKSTFRTLYKKKTNKKRKSGKSSKSKK